MNPNRKIMFNATGDGDIWQRLAKTGHYQEGVVETWPFGDGEVYHRLHERNEWEGRADVTVQNGRLNQAAPKKSADAQADEAAAPPKGMLAGREVVVVGDLASNKSVMETLDVCNAIFDEAALGLTLVLPKDTLPKNKFQREALIELFNSVPATARGNRVVLVDRQSQGVPEFSPLKMRKARKPLTDPAFELFGDSSQPVILHTSSYGYLATDMMKHGSFELGQWDTHEVDGRAFFKKLKTNLRGRTVVIVSGTIDDTETMELYYMSRAVALAGAVVRKNIVAYYGHGTMERKVLPGEAVKAKIRARLLSGIPGCPLGNHVVMCDLHTEGIPYYMEGGLQPAHVYVAKHLVSAVSREMVGLPSDDVLGRLPLALPDPGALESPVLKGPALRLWPSADELNATLARLPRGRKPVLCATDAGRHNWIKSIGRDVRLATAFGRKERTGPDKTEFVGVLGDVLEKDALEYDDKLGTGGTAAEAAAGIRLDQYGAALLEHAGMVGADKVDPGIIPDVLTVFVGTHGLFAGKALEKLSAKDIFGRPVINYVVVADTHPRAKAVADGKRIFVKSTAYLLARAVLD